MLNFLLVANKEADVEQTSMFIKDEYGFTGLQFCNKKEAVYEKVREVRPDTIILDYGFDDNQAIGFCHQLKNHPVTKKIPVIILGEATIASEERNKSLQAGADYFLSAPFDKVGLIAVINLVIRANKIDKQQKNNNEKLNEKLTVTENEISKKEKRYALMFDSAENIIVLINRNKQIEEWNKAAENIFELSKENALGQNFEKIILNKIMRADINDKISSGEIDRGKNEYQINIKTASGKKYQILWTISTLVNEGNQLNSILVIGQDVSARFKEGQESKRSESKLRSNVDFLNTLIESMPSPVYYKNTDGIYLGCNADFGALFGLKPGQIIGKHTSDINSGEEAKQIIKEDQEVFESGEKQIKEIATKGKNGKNHHFILNKTAFLNPDHTIGGLVGVMVEVTKLKRMEEELRASEMFFKGITDSANDAIVLIDKKCGIHFWNKAAEFLFGYKQDEIINTSFCQLIHKNENREIFAHRIEEVFLNRKKNMESNILEIEAYHRGKKVFPAEFSLSSIRIRNKDFIIIIGKDITLRERARTTLLEAKEKAEEADRLKSSFLSNMSHEIRTPMNAIVGFSQLLANSALDKAKREIFVEQINLNSDSLMQLIEDIIFVSKIEAGKVAINKTTCLLNTLLDDLLISFNEHKRRMGKEHLELTAEKAISSPTFSISSDNHRLKQILTNLIGNAIKFTEQGSISFGYSIKKQKELLFFVKDTGLGINKEKIKYIFDRFTKISANKTKLYGGTGLGLSITQHLVDCLGGKIWVESEEGKGSVFYFTHPYQGAEYKKEDVSIEENLNTDMSLENMNILIAEDEQMNFFFLEEALSITGAKIEWAKNGQEAVTLVEGNTLFDIVLMDMKMPVMDGYEATAKIKKLKPELPVIAQTAYAMPEEQEKGYEAGCDSYLSKPIDPDLLINTIRKHIKRK